MQFLCIQWIQINAVFMQFLCNYLGIQVFLRILCSFMQFYAVFMQFMQTPKIYAFYAASILLMIYNSVTIHYNKSHWHIVWYSYSYTSVTV